MKPAHLRSLAIVAAGALLAGCPSSTPSAGTPYRPDRDGGPQGGDNRPSDPRHGDPVPGDPNSPTDPNGADPGTASDPGGGDPAPCVDPSIGPEWFPCRVMALNGNTPLVPNTAYAVTWGDTTHTSAAYVETGCDPTCLASEYCAVGPACCLNNQVDILSNPGATNCVDFAGGYDDIFMFQAGSSGDVRVRVEDITGGSAYNLSAFLVFAWWDSCGNWLCSNSLFTTAPPSGYFADCEYDDPVGGHPDFTSAIIQDIYYYVIIDGEDGAADMGQYKLTVTSPP